MDTYEQIMGLCEINESSLRARSHCGSNGIISIVVMSLKWVLHPIVMAIATEKMGLMATDGDVRTKGSFTPNDSVNITVTLMGGTFDFHYYIK